MQFPIFALATIVLLKSLTKCIAVPVENFPSIVDNTKLNTQIEDAFKRSGENIYTDGQLKDASLKSLVDGVEDSLYQSALSAQNANVPGSVVQEIKPAIIKRESINSADANPIEETTTAVNRPHDGVIVQTTRRVPEADSVPAHILVDRVAVLPHTEGTISFLPVFHVQQPKLVTSTIIDDVANNQDEQTKISTIETKMTSTVKQDEQISTEDASTVDDTTTDKYDALINTEISTVFDTSTSTTSTASSTTEKPETSSTAKEPIEKIKQEEEQLKEKVAEIEAVPVILSARV